MAEDESDPNCAELLLRMGQDEGMWPLNRVPRERLAQTYGFNPSEEWLKHVTRASVRLNSGGSGSFVSSSGLLMTNHHVARGTLQKLSGPGRDLLHTGFLARTQAEELRTPDLEVNQLQNIQDVTARVLRGLTPDLPPAKAQAQRRANIAEIEKRSFEETGLKSEVVELFLGAEYHLYQYKVYKDVRLVFAPEGQIAGFGGDALNFEFPRFSLDLTFLRVYNDAGEPLRTDDFFKWSKAGPSEGELVFVTGHPGTTNRLFTLAAMEFARDVQVPFSLATFSRRIQGLEKYSEISPEHERQAKSELLSLQNSFKVLSGDARGLASEELFELKRREEHLLRQRVDADAKLSSLGGGWWEIERAMSVNFEEFIRRSLISDGAAFSSRLFQLARMLVRVAEEDEKPNAVRLPFYRESARPSLELDLFSAAPIYKEFEIYKLSDSLAYLSMRLSPSNPIVIMVLAGKSPAERARELVEGSTLDQLSVRKELMAGKRDAIRTSKDPMIQLALRIDGEARHLRLNYEQKVETPTQLAYAKIAKLRYALFGNSEYPDATFSLRLAFGRVKGYEVYGLQVPAWTSVQQLMGMQRPGNNDFTLPESWQQPEIEWGPVPIPLNFVSTADTIGGNSGSPVINTDAEIVGLNFDSNREKIQMQRYLYTEGASRHISVHSVGIVEILRRVYRADALVEELGH